MLCVRLRPRPLGLILDGTHRPRCRVEREPRGVHLSVRVEVDARRRVGGRRVDEVPASVPRERRLPGRGVPRADRDVDTEGVPAFQRCGPEVRAPDVHGAHAAHRLRDVASRGVRLPHHHLGAETVHAAPLDGRGGRVEGIDAVTVAGVDVPCVPEHGRPTHRTEAQSLRERQRSRREVDAVEVRGDDELMRGGHLRRRLPRDVAPVRHAHARLPELHALGRGDRAAVR